MSVHLLPIKDYFATGMTTQTGFVFNSGSTKSHGKEIVKVEVSEDPPSESRGRMVHCSSAPCRLMLSSRICAAAKVAWDCINPSELASKMLGMQPTSKPLVVDCRSFLHYNSQHIKGALNISCGDKFKQKRLLSGRLQIGDLVSPHEARIEWRDRQRREIVLYDEKTREEKEASPALKIVLKSLRTEGVQPKILQGGWTDFHSQHEDLCRKVEAPQIERLCEPQTPNVEEQPISKVLPFLFLGNECDSRSAERLREHNITAVINVTQKSPMPPPEAQVKALRLPAADNGNQNLRKFFQEAFDFIESVREEGGAVLIHCFAGISRSATLTIAYLMKYHAMSMNDAYTFVKSCRPLISPNINFMGQLLQLEEELAAERGVAPSAPGCDLTKVKEIPKLTIPASRMRKPRPLSVDPDDVLDEPVDKKRTPPVVEHNPFKFNMASCVPSLTSNVGDYSTASLHSNSDGLSLACQDSEAAVEPPTPSIQLNDPFFSPFARLSKTLDLNADISTQSQSDISFKNLGEHESAPRLRSVVSDPLPLPNPLGDILPCTSLELSATSTPPNTPFKFTAAAAAQELPTSDKDTSPHVDRAVDLLEKCGV